MAAIDADPILAREFARTVVARLRAAGHEALWAGGCVRDELLGRTPADYDVATSAIPDAVRALFGRSRTLAIGAAFGVITVIGPRGAGQVEVTTFRTDAAYTDGRHPAEVRFSSAAEDAKRRDFTINGLFLDPEAGIVHDHVGGRADLEAGIVRAIGVPGLRFGEDHLRMLRAVRFAAGFGFLLEAETRAAIERLAGRVVTVSPERIAAELRAMLSRPGRGRALGLLADTGLAAVILPELAPSPSSPSAANNWRVRSAVIEALDEPSLAVGLAVLAGRNANGAMRSVTAICRRLRLSNRESRCAAWLRDALDAFGETPGMETTPQEGVVSRPWSWLQPWLAHADAPLLADALRAQAAHGLANRATAAWVSRQVERPAAELAPPPLLTGSDLLHAGIPAGAALGATLARLRALQLDGIVTTSAAARDWLAALPPASEPPSGERP